MILHGIHRMNPDLRLAIRALAVSAEELVLLATAIRDAVTAMLEEPTATTATTATEPALASALATEAPAPFRPASLALHKSLSKEERQAEGIFFTPAPLRQRLFDVLALHGAKPATVLEPSFGSGEFLHDAQAQWPAATLYGVEKNPALFRSVPETTGALTCADFLAYPPRPVDLILGNPPYFVTKAKDPACMTGRGNIYVQFIYKCLMSHLNPGGILAFVLPTSFYNCSYYQPCRDAIRREATVLHCETLEGGFYETVQDTMLLVLRKTPSATNPFFVEMQGNTVLSPHARELETLVAGTTTLKALGFAVKTGEIVWNEHKADLHDTEGTLVLYTGNIVGTAIVLKETMTAGKKQYIQRCAKEPVQGPALIVCRGYGNAFRMSYAYVPEGTTFYGENHINVITATTEAAKALFPRVLASFADARTAAFLRMAVGNGALSKTELESVLPVFT
jgi:adenine-specific DNA-methyltransferase